MCAMKKKDLKVGETYFAKVSDKLVQVKIVGESRFGGWDGINLTTGKKVRIKSAQRLRGAVGGQDAATDVKKGRTARNAKPPAETAQAQTSAPTSEDVATLPSAPTGEPEAKTEAVPTTCPNCGATEVDEDGDCAKCHEPKVAGKDAKADNTPKADKVKKPRAKKAPKRISGLDAAAMVLEQTGTPMTAKEMVEVAEAKGYWKSPSGKTPHQTIVSAIIREITTKGGASRFTKAERGKFAAKR